MMVPTWLRHSKTQGGFTVIELLIVITIAAVMASVLTLGIRQASDSFALRRAASITVSEIRRAQGAAVSERRDFYVEFNFSNPPQGLNIFSLQDDGITWALVRTIRAPQAGMDGNWPATVSINGPASTFAVCTGAPGVDPGTPPNHCLRFTPFGEPIPNGDVVLRNTRGTELRVRVAPATGQVSILP